MLNFKNLIAKKSAQLSERLKPDQTRINTETETEINILVLGGKKVGKKSLINRYVTGSNENIHIVAQNLFQIKKIRLIDSHVTVKLWYVRVYVLTLSII